MDTTQVIDSLSAEQICDALQQLPVEKQTKVVKGAAGNLPPKNQKEVKNSLGEPSNKVKDYLWRAVITTFCIVLTGSFITLAISVFVNGAGASEQVILTVFTGVLGFLTGIFVPSPIVDTEG